MNLEAFLAADFGYTRQLPSIWGGRWESQQQLNHEVFEIILDDFAKASSPNENALGAVVIGPAGSGKTHLMGSLRAKVMAQGSHFVLLDLAGVREFWTTAALGFVASVHQATPSGKPQFRVCLERIAQQGGAHFAEFVRLLNELLKGSAARITPGQRQQLVAYFMSGLSRHYGPAALEHQYVVRAYLNLLLGDDTLRFNAYSWLMGTLLDDSSATALGVPPSRDPHMIVKGTMWMLSRTASTLIVIDQIDAIVAQHNVLVSSVKEEERAAVIQIIQGLATGLMSLYDIPGRSMTVVSCLPETWTVLVQRSIQAVQGRFGGQQVLRPIADADGARTLVEERLRAAYTEKGFKAPYPTYPFKPEAFSSAARMLPRQLLQLCEKHRVRCRLERAITELDSFIPEEKVPVSPPVSTEGLDQKFERAKAAADTAHPLAVEGEELLEELLVEGLSLVAAQLDDEHDDIDFVVQDDRGLARPSLTARFKAIYRKESDREIHVCFRVLQHPNAIAFQAKLRAALTESGLQRELPFRHLRILRTPAVPSGEKGRILTEQALALGARFVSPPPEGIAVLRALLSMREENGFAEWLRKSEHLRRVPIFAELMGLVLRENGTGPDKPNGAAEKPSKAAPKKAPGGRPVEAKPVASSPDAATFDPATIAIGNRLEGGQVGPAQALPVSVLPRHVAILAGSGSGKTVLIRRLVEESVLRGLPAVVLDPNNDLSLLGDAWPAPPSGWGADDPALAKRYLGMADVVIWTPGSSKGRPMMLDVVPDFPGLIDGGADADELEEAVQMTVTTVGSFIGVTEVQRGVLADAVRAFAQRRLSGLKALATFLQDLPTGVSAVSSAGKAARTIGDKVHAAISSNPLLMAQGAPLDPAALFESGHKGRVRVSVISFAGLASEEARRDFVHRLQMALFTFVKAHPSPRGRLYVVDEAHLFMGQRPEMTASRESGRSLVAQARKYGLGVVVATQNPKDLQHTIISSCTTHLYGKMNSPSSIGAIRELAAAKGGSITDIAAMSPGVFYFSSENQPAPVRIRTHLCLSHHPSNPPSGDEVIRRAGAAANAG